MGALSKTKMDSGKPTRVLHLVLTLAVGGLENLVYQMIVRSREQGIIADLACLDHGGHYARQLVERNVRVIEMCRHGPLDVRAIMRLALWCRRNGVQVVHSHSGCMLYAALLGWMCPTLRIVHTDHGRHHPESLAACMEERVACRRVDRIVAVAHVLRDHITRVVRCPPNRVSVIWNGVDLQKFRPPSGSERLQAREALKIHVGAKVLGTVGRMAAVKNQGLLLRAFASVSRKVDALRLLLVGDGLLRQSLEEQARQLAVGDRVIFTGASDSVQLMLWAMDLFCLSSDSEAMPVTVVEARATGLPCVVTAVGDLPRLAAQVSGIVCVPRRNEELFAEAIYQGITTSAGPLVSGFDGESLRIETMMNEYLALYRDLTGQRRLPLARGT